MYVASSLWLSYQQHYDFESIPEKDVTNTNNLILVLQT